MKLMIIAKIRDARTCSSSPRVGSVHTSYTVNTSHNTQPQHTAQLPKNTDTMISPAHRLPADPILQVSAITMRRAINLDHRNTAMRFTFT